MNDKMKFWVLVGEGANDVMIPALIFTDKDKALSRCKKIFGSEPKEYQPNSEISSVHYRWVDVDGLDMSAIEQMYTSYYGGCGECYAATLMEVEEGSPFVCFNLD